MVAVAREIGQENRPAPVVHALNRTRPEDSMNLILRPPEVGGQASHRGNSQAWHALNRLSLNHLKTALSYGR